MFDFGSIIGGAMNDPGLKLGIDRMNSKYEWDRGVDRQNELLAREERLQREFAQHGIQWRVEDAQRAGLHPVFALSGGGSAYSPPSVSVGGDSGVRWSGMPSQDISRAVHASQGPSQRAQAQLMEAEARSRIARNEAEAAMFGSIEAKNYAGLGPGVPVGVDPAVMADPRFGGADSSNRVLVKPAEVTSRAGNDASSAAGRDVAWRQYTIGADGRKIWAPNASSFAEALEGVSESWPLTMLWIRENMARNPQFLYENRHMVPYGEEMSRMPGAWERIMDRVTDPDSYGGKAHERLNLRRGLRSPRGRYPNFGY